jgi:hypothetical protein
MALPRRPSSKPLLLTAVLIASFVTIPLLLFTIADQYDAHAPQRKHFGAYPLEPNLEPYSGWPDTNITIKVNDPSFLETFGADVDFVPRTSIDDRSFVNLSTTPSRIDRPRFSVTDLRADMRSGRYKITPLETGFPHWRWIVSPEKAESDSLVIEIARARTQMAIASEPLAWIEVSVEAVSSLGLTGRDEARLAAIDGLLTLLGTVFAYPWVNAILEAGTKSEKARDKF